MNKRQLAVIEKALLSEQELFPLNQTWQSLHNEYNIGLTSGLKLKLKEDDKRELAMLVKQKTGIDIFAQPLEKLAGLSREQALNIAADEKLAGQAVKKDRLAIKPLPGQALKINGQNHRLPNHGHLDLALPHLESCQHSSLLVIENYRCFDRLDKLNLVVAEPFSQALVVYRGDNSYRENTVRQLVAQLNLPVLVMPDLDPKGLLIAQSFPNAIGLLAPPLDEIEKLFAQPRYLNPTLYNQQLMGCQHLLNNSPHPLLIKLWRIMRTTQAGVVQEHWLNEAFQLRVLLFDYETTNNP